MKLHELTKTIIFNCNGRRLCLGCYKHRLCNEVMLKSSTGVSTYWFK